MTLEATVVAVISADAVVGGVLEFLRGLLEGVDVGGVLKSAMVRKFALGGGGALGIVMLGHYMRKAEVVIRVLSTGGLFLMLVGVLSLLGVVDLNVSRVATAIRGVLGA